MSTSSPGLPIHPTLLAQHGPCVRCLSMRAIYMFTGSRVCTVQVCAVHMCGLALCAVHMLCVLLMQLLVHQPV